MKQSLALLLLCAAPAFPQTEKPAKPAPPDPFAVKYVYGAPWESGELRTCSTYSNHPNFLLCDDDVRTAVTVGWKDHQKIDPERPLTMTIPDGKRFLVQFSRDRGGSLRPILTSNPTIPRPSLPSRQVPRHGKPVGLLERRKRQPANPTTSRVIAIDLSFTCQMWMLS